jgi:uncharacterized protein YndB with AHSA1/START domain
MWLSLGASRRRPEVYRAHTDPSLVKWMLGPGGQCRFASTGAPGRQDPLRVDQRQGRRFYLTGEFLELVPFSRIVHVERMHMPDPCPDNHVVTTFTPDGTGTLMTMRMTLPDAQMRAAMLSTGMEHGMEASYVRLETMI